MGFAGDYPNNFRSGYMGKGVPLPANEKYVMLTADDTQVSPENVGLIRIASDSTTATVRTFTLLASPLIGHRLTITFVSAASTTCQLVSTGTTQLQGDWTPVLYGTIELISTGTYWVEVGRGLGAISSNTITLAMLTSGIAPSHVVKFAGKHTTTGGSATDAFTVTGVATTDIVFATVQTVGVTPRTIVSAAPTLNTVTVVWSGDPSTDHIVSYQVLRAAS